jgi:hypothetical protein
MSRSTAREERDEQHEHTELGRMVLSQGRSGGASASSGDGKIRPRSAVEAAGADGTPEPASRRPQALSRDRELLLVRDRAYRISGRERALMTELGRFRTVAVTDLAEYRYGHHTRRLREDVANLKDQKLIRQRRVMFGKGREKFSVLVLTKEGKRVVEQEEPNPSEQTFYAGFVKPHEVAHDAAIYRMYQVEAAMIEKQGGTVRRVVLDYELKRNVYSPLGRARHQLPPLQFAQRQAEVAAVNGLKVIEGKIPLPDLRIEYETAEGELAKADLELATEHYHGAHVAGKLNAGFKTYADRATAARLNAALTYGGSAVHDGELTVEILSL